MVDFALSVSDLNLIDEFKEVFEASIAGFPELYDVIEECGERHIFLLDPEILKYLRSNGMNTDEPVEVVFAQHRNLQNKIVSCYRFEGQERLDKEWIGSGSASLDAIICSSKDKSMRSTLRGMSVDRPQERGFE